jgi:hypothetical protein
MRMGSGTIRQHNDMNVTVSCTALRNKTATTQAFIVWMRCQHKDRLMSGQVIKIKERQILHLTEGLCGPHHRPHVTEQARSEMPHVDP